MKQCIWVPLYRIIYIGRHITYSRAPLPLVDALEIFCYLLTYSTLYTGYQITYISRAPVYTAFIGVPVPLYRIIYTGRHITQKSGAILHCTCTSGAKLHIYPWHNFTVYTPRYTRHLCIDVTYWVCHVEICSGRKRKYVASDGCQFTC